MAATAWLASSAVLADLSWPDESATANRQLMLLEGDILANSGELTARGIGLRGPTSSWPDGIVPYRIDARLEPASAGMVREAIARWNAVGGVTLVPLDEAPTDLQSSSILFQSGPGCASWVGRQGGEQPLWVGPTCNTGSIMHEIGHAFGLEHEHTRPDRDEHIVIHRDKINPTKLHNFEITDFRSRVLGDYDYASIMHYGPNFFSIDGSPTMEPLVPTAVAIGQRTAPSPGDLDSLARLYGTDLSLTSETAVVSRQQTGTGADIDVTLHVTNQSQQGANGLMLTLATQGLEVVDMADDDWHCERTVTTLDCHLDRLTGDAHSTLALSLRGQLDDYGLRALLDSATPDDDITNNTALVVADASGAELADDLLGGPGGESADLPTGAVAFDLTGAQSSGPAPTQSATESGDSAAEAAGNPNPPVQPAVAGTVPLFEVAPEKQPAPPSDVEASASAAGAFALWLPLLATVIGRGLLVRREVRRLAVRHVGLIGKLVEHTADA